MTYQQRPTTRQFQPVSLAGTFSTASEKSRSRAAICIIGDPGAGKTMLSCSMPNTFLLDVEGRGSHANAELRYVPTQTMEAHAQIATIIKELQRQKADDSGMIEYQGHKIGTVVLDTIDHLQELLKEKYLGISNGQKMYGLLLNDILYDIVLPLLSLPLNIIIVAHTAQYDPKDESEKKQGDPTIFPTVTFALEGSIRNRLRNHFDNVLHIVAEQNGKRTIVTSPSIIDQRFIFAKDTLYLFGGKSMPMSWKPDGTVDASSIKTVFSVIQGGPRVKAAIDAAKKKISEALKAKGYTNSDAAFLLGESLQNLNAAKRVEDVIGLETQCLDKLKLTPEKAKASE